MRVRPNHLIRQAKERFALQDYYGCILLLEEVLESGRVYADVHHLHGLALHLSGQADRAILSFDQALEINPQYHEAHLHRGIVLNDLGRSSEAQDAFTAAYDSRGTDRDGIPGHLAANLANQHAVLGEAYAEANVLSEAIEQYRTALRLGPTFHDLRYRLARLLLEAGRVLEAREELETLVAARPRSTEARGLLGLARYMAGDLQAAEDMWMALQSEQPDAKQTRAYMTILKQAPNGDSEKN